MSTLSIRALHMPKVWPLARFTRVILAIATVIDVFAEAQEMARAAHKRYPFVEG